MIGGAAVTLVIVGAAPVLVNVAVAEAVHPFDEVPITV